MTRVLLLAAVTVAVVTRAWGLSSWSLDGDEFYSHWNVADLLAGKPWPEGVRSHPLGYLGMAASAAAFGLAPWSLRLFPALCGAGAVLALAVLRRDAVPRATAAGAALLAALSPWLLYHAQTARFYGPLLLFATLATLWALPGPGWRPWSAAVAWLAAVACHPSALLLGLGLAAPALHSPRRARALVAPLLFVAAAVATALLLPGSNVVKTVAKAALTRTRAHYDPLHFVAGLGYNLGVGVGLLAAVGLVLAVRTRARDLLVPAVAATVPVAILLGAALFGVSMHQRYAMASVPAALLLAGHGWAALARRGGPAFVAATAVALLAPLPDLVSYARDGNRHDMRGAAAWLSEHAHPDDILVADEHRLLLHYLDTDPAFAGMRVHEAPIERARTLRRLVAGRDESWVVLKQNRLGAAYGETFGGWLEDYYEEAARVGAERLPLSRHVNTLVIWRRRARVPADEVVLRGDEG